MPALSAISAVSILPFGGDYAARVLSTNPLAYWMMAEAAGAVAIDATGNGYDGAYTAVTLGEPGIGDGRTSARFDGATSFLDIFTAGFAAAFNGAEGSFMLWLQAANLGVWTDATTRFFMRLRVDADNSIQINRVAVNNRIISTYEAGAVVESNTDDTVKTTAWYNAFMTWSVAVDEVRYYLNGIPLSTDTILGVWAGIPIAATTLIGAQSQVPAAVWDGRLAHGGFWTRPLPPAEVFSLGRPL